jgi:hypothetical protein
MSDDVVELDNRLAVINDAIESLMNAATSYYGDTLKNRKTIYQKLEFLQGTPFYSAFELCLNDILDIYITELRQTEVVAENIPDDIQEQIYAIISLAYVLNKDNLLHAYISRVDWSDWHPINTVDPGDAEMYGKLTKRYPALLHQFPPPSS